MGPKGRADHDQEHGEAENQLLPVLLEELPGEARPRERWRRLGESPRMDSGRVILGGRIAGYPRQLRDAPTGLDRPHPLRPVRDRRLQPVEGLVEFEGLVEPICPLTDIGGDRHGFRVERPNGEDFPA